MPNRTRSTVFVGRPDPVVWTVYGVPAPQGSARAFLHKTTRRVIVTHANRRTMSWRQEVAAALVQVLPPANDPIFRRPAAVEVRATFYLPRPKSLPKRIQTPAARPDLDKLLRAALDAMTGLVFDDDAQVAAITASKAYGVPRAEFEIKAILADPCGSVPAPGWRDQMEAPVGSIGGGTAA